MKFRDYSNYEIYDGGKIWSYKRSKFLKPSTLPNGYQKVTLTDNEGKQKNYYIHRVVWEAVTGEPIPSNMEINHISEVKTENFFENLQLVTHKYNVNYGTRNARAGKSISKANKNNQKLLKSLTNNPKKSKAVCAFKDEKLVLTFQSTQEAQRNGFNHSAVSRCCNGKLPNYKGYEWRYI